MKKTLRFIGLLGFGLNLILGPLSVQAFEIQQLSKPCPCAMACCGKTGRTAGKSCCQLKPGPSWNVLTVSQARIQKVSVSFAGPTAFQPSAVSSVSREVRTQESPPGPSPQLSSVPSNRAPPAA